MIKKRLCVLVLFAAKSISGAAAAAAVSDASAHFFAAAAAISTGEGPISLDGRHNFSPDGTLKVMVQDDKSYAVQNVASKKILWASKARFSDKYPFFSFSPSSKFLIFAESWSGPLYDHSVWWNIFTAQHGFKIDAVFSNELSWHQNDDFFSYNASIDGERVIRLSKPLTGESNFFPGKKILAISSKRNRCVVLAEHVSDLQKDAVCLYNMKTNKIENSLEGKCLCEDPDQKSIALQVGRQIHFYDIDTFHKVAEIDISGTNLKKMVWDNEKRMCALVAAGRAIDGGVIIDTKIGGAPRGFFPMWEKKFWWDKAQWSDNGRKFLLKTENWGSNDDQVVCVTDFNNIIGDRIFFIKSKKHIIDSALLTPSGSHLALLKHTRDRTKAFCALYNVGEKKKLWKFPVPSTTSFIKSISPEGGYLGLIDNSQSDSRPGYSLYRAASSGLIKTAEFSHPSAGFAYPYLDEKITLTDEMLMIDRQKFALADGRVVDKLSL